MPPKCECGLCREMGEGYHTHFAVHTQLIPPSSWEDYKARRSRKSCLFMRKFITGATRDSEEGKLDYEGFLSPAVLKAYAEYMNKHRIQSDHVRDSDDWQKGIPKEVYMKSAWRHFFDWWLEHRGHKSRDGLKDALCGLLFNAMGYLHELLKEE